MGEVSDRLKGALADRYAIEREVGAGGMATVYLATDRRHDRNVALKVLNPELAAVVGAERFLSEIRTTANLQHPHILPLFDSGEADGFLFYVMPYIDGESLRDRLDRDGQLPVDEAVTIAGKVASALQYAHERGVIHRDIKPANILMARGEPMVADFGIALAVSAAGRGRLTETGLSLGTPHYMSPEQATGQRAPGPASDVYSLACVLYEMLAGEPPHTGSSAQAVLAKILTEEPRRVAGQRASVPEHVDGALDRALQRLPADRFSSAAAFASALSDHSVAAKPRANRSRVASTKRMTWRSTATMASIAVLGVAAAWGWIRAPELPVAPGPLRATISLPFPTSGEGRRINISPDGRWIVFTASRDGTRRLHVRRASRDETEELPGTENASFPAFSPDSRWIVFSSPDGLSKVAVEGGPVLVLVRAQLGILSPTWAPDGFIYATVRSQLARIPEAGGEPEVLLERCPEGGEISYPELLPGGRAVLFTCNRTLATSDVMLFDVGTGTARALTRGVHARYLPTGHIVFGEQSQTLMAVAFDLDRLEIIGSPAPALSGVRVFNGGSTQFAVSETGTAVYLSGATADELGLVLMDRAGTADTLQVTIAGDRRSRVSPRFSPDGRSIVFEDAQQLRLFDLDLGTNAQLTSSGRNWYPVWSDGGRTITFASSQGGPNGFDVYRMAVDGGAEPELLFSRPQNQFAYGWSRDGGTLVVRHDVSPTNRDIWLVNPTDTSQSRPFLQGEWFEEAASLSPDGRFIAYESQESGTSELWVRDFPEGRSRWKVSVGEGIEPVWSRDGSRLYYRTPLVGDTLVAAVVRVEPTFQVLSREIVFDRLGGYDTYSSPASYDIHPTDGRFVFVSTGRTAPDAEITLVSGWFEELRATLGGGSP